MDKLNGKLSAVLNWQAAVNPAGIRTRDFYLRKAAFPDKNISDKKENARYHGKSKERKYKI